MKTSEEVWCDIRRIMKSGQRIQTICQRSVNDIIEVGPIAIQLSSHRSKTHKVRTVTKDDIAYVWRILSTQGIYTLQPLEQIIGKRAVVCAIIASLSYVEGKCDRGRVSLKLV